MILLAYLSLPDKVYLKSLSSEAVNVSVTGVVCPLSLSSFLLYMLNSKHICPFYVYTG